uniref:NAD(P)H-hydrate epimerase n=1 Tax=Coccolithus braarudii TaxID=221442 RepID=A0A7S0LIF6_9EUKA
MPTLCILSQAARSLSLTPAPTAVMKLKLLSQQEAVEIDEALMKAPGFSIDQLMELAGLSVAAAVAQHYPMPCRVLCVCGPGNNGGDGLVAARHLWQFGYSPTVVYPKRPQKTLFVNLAAQMDMMGIPLLQELPTLTGEYDVILDAVFGFSFSGAVRAPFDTILPAISASGLPIVSVDIPSGWDVERGPTDATGALQPDVLVSLTMPKACSSHFAGAHYLGGRFVPRVLAQQFGFEQPTFPGTAQVVRI